MATMLDWAQVQGALKEINESTGINSKREVFSPFMVDLVSGIGFDEAQNSITDGGNDRGIDAVAMFSRGQKTFIHFYQFKFVNDFSKATNNVSGASVDKIISFVQDLLRKDESLKENCNPLLWLKVQDIWEALNEGPINFQVNICSNCDGLHEIDLNRLKEGLKQYDFTVKQYGLEKISRLILGGGKKEFTKKIRLIDEQRFERTDGNVRGLIGSVNALDWVNFLRHEDYKNEIEKSLFEENVRVYLGEKNAINQKIFKTAVSDISSQFWYLNNGITIVCESYEYQPGASNPVVKIKNPQIVNGGQTSFALFDAASSDQIHIKNVRVLLRIIETKDPNFTNRIAEATNSQTPIRSRDLRSNDEIQIQIEDILRSEGYYYSRKKNQYPEAPIDKKIDALTLGQIILAYYVGEPSKAKTQSDDIFGRLYELVFDENFLSIEKILTAYKLYDLINQRKKISLQKLRNGQRNVLKEDWAIEGNFHVLFMLKVLGEKEGIPLDDFEKISNLMPMALAHVAGFRYKRKNTAAYRLFRSTYSKSELSSFSVPEQMEFEIS